MAGSSISFARSLVVALCILPTAATDSACGFSRGVRDVACVTKVADMQSQTGYGEEVVSLMQLSKPKADVRWKLEAGKWEVETNQKQQQEELDEHPEPMYNFGVNWDEYYDDMMHLFPPSDAGYKTMNFGLASEPLHACAASVPAGDPIMPFNHTTGANMYAMLASKSATSLKNAKVLEISSGRGGGSAVLSDCFCPSQMTGLDFSAKQVTSAQSSYGRKGNCPIEFQHGNAMEMPFGNASFDVVINVEASHTYPSYRKFVQEAHRVLRPGGAFLTTDFREVSDSAKDADIIGDVFQKPVNPVDVTSLVLRSLDENQLISPFVHSCMGKYKEILLKSEKYEKYKSTDWKPNKHGLGVKNPLSCAEMSGALFKLFFAAGDFNYRMYAMSK